MNRRSRWGRRRMWWGHIILPVHQHRLLMMGLRRRGRVVVVVDIRKG